MAVEPVTTYVQLSVNSDSDATPIGMPGAYRRRIPNPADLTVTIKALPQNGTVSLDGTAVVVGQTLSVDDLTALAFTPGSYDQAFDLIYTVTDLNGNSVDGAASLAILGEGYSPILSSPDLQIASGTATPLGIQPPVNAQESAAIQAIIVDSLPSTGTVTLADGVTPVTSGQELTLDELSGLMFTPNPGVGDVCDTFSYDVFNYPVGYGTGTVTLSIGAADSPVVSSPNVPVIENTQTALGISAPSDPNYAASDLTITVTSLPTNGSVTLADGTTPVTVGETLSVDQLTSLLFNPTPDASDVSSVFTYTVADPGGNSSMGSVTIAVGGASADPVVASPTVSVTENTLTALGLAAPTDPNYAASALTITVGALPSNGTVTLANGAAVSAGETLTVAQLTGLLFAPTSGLFDSSSTFTYTVTDPAENSSTGTATLAIGAAVGNPVVTSASLTVAEDAGPTALAIQAPTDPNYDASQLVVTVFGLPTDGTVTLADGTAINTGETLTVAQLTGLMFTPTAGYSNVSSAFDYLVADPQGNSTPGSATVNIAVGAADPTVSSPIVPVTENMPVALGIAAPSDPNYVASALTITVTGLPTNGAVTLADGTTPVTAGETLTTDQLTSLLFTPTPGLFAASDIFTYTVTDPAENSSTGTVTLSIGAAVGDPVAASPTISVAENTQTALNLPAPTDPNYDASALTITVIGLPSNGTVTLADGTTAVTAGETLSIAELTGLLFNPTPGLSNTTGTFGYLVVDPAGNTEAGTATLAIPANPGSPTASSSTVPVSENTPVALGIAAPADPNEDPSLLTVTVTGLPSNGTITLADGTTPVTAGETLTVAQLTSLKFTPTAQLFGASSTFAYTVTNSAMETAGGSVILAIGPAVGNPIVGSTSVGVTENTPTSLNIAPPADPNYNSSNLTITVDSLPGNGTLTLANGTTPVAVGEILSVAQLGSLLFSPTPGFFNVNSAFVYTVADPAGNASAGNVMLAIGPAVGNPSVSSPSLTVAENSGPTALGITAPTDPNYSPASLIITASGLPTDGAITLADGTPVTAGENSDHSRS